VTARGSTALCISVAAYQPATRQHKRRSLILLPFLLKKSLYNPLRAAAGGLGRLLDAKDDAGRVAEEILMGVDAIGQL
jgi:hypothetical protein